MWWTESGPNVDADLSLEIIALRRGEDLRVFVDRLQFPYEVLFGTSAGSWAVASTRTIRAAATRHAPARGCERNQLEERLGYR
jgi:hypothetical protein